MKLFRSGASSGPLAVWTVLAGCGAYLLHPVAFGAGSRALYLALFCACIVLGPLSFGAYVLRCVLQTVSVDPSRGLILSWGSVISWRAVRSISHYAGPFSADLSGSMTDGPADDDPWHWGHFLGDGVLLYWVAVLFFHLAYYLLLPALVLLSPWCPKVTVQLADGRTLVYRDLVEGELFVRMVKVGISGRSDATQKLREMCTRAA